MSPSPLRVLVIGGDASAWVGLSTALGSRASQIFVSPDVQVSSLARAADDLDVILVVAAGEDPDPCLPLRTLTSVGLSGRTVLVSGSDDVRTAREAMDLGIGGYVARGAASDRVAAAVQQVSRGGVFFDAPAAALTGRSSQEGASIAPAARALANALELKDTYTGGHAERVAAMAMRLATAAKTEDLAPPDVLEVAFLLHDVGKIGIPESILVKPGSLSDTERRVLQTHPILGERIIGPLGLPDTVRQVVRHHHERWDGTGYPDGLAGDDIPAAARIFSVADVIDAMTSFRPYRSPLSLQEAISEVLRNAGTQFDPALAAVAEEVFLRDTISLFDDSALGQL